MHFRRLIVVSFVLLFDFSARAQGPSDVLKQFESLYREKKFQEASALLNTSEAGDVEKDIGAGALRRMWDCFYDEKTKRENVASLITINREKIAVAKEELKELKAGKDSDGEILRLKEDIAAIEGQIDLLGSLAGVEADVSGPVIEEKIIGDYAVVATRAHIRFPGSYNKEIRSFVREAKSLAGEKAYKHTVFEKGGLTIPVLFYFVDMSCGWRIMLFSSENFPENMFDEFLAQYETGLEDFDWMAGGEARIFWEEEISRRRSR